MMLVSRKLLRPYAWLSATVFLRRKIPMPLREERVPICCSVLINVTPSSLILVTSPRLPMSQRSLVLVGMF